MADQPAPQVPHIADGAGPADALPTLIARVYGDAAPPLRLKLLSLLLRPVGPLALVAIAAGAFGSLLHRRPWQTPGLTSLDDAAQISAEQVFELARYVEQACPELLMQVGTLVTDNFASVGAFSGALLLHAVRHWSKRRSRDLR